MTDGSNEAMEIVSRLLVGQGPLSEDEIVARLRADGVSDPESVARNGLDEMHSPTGQLVDDRWVWLPALLTGRVFNHRVTEIELAHDLLVVTPDLGAITELCEHRPYQVLADGSPISVMVDDFDDDVLEERGVPNGVVGEGGALLLPVATLSALAVTAGDLVGVRLSNSGLVIERVTDVDSSTDVASMLTSTLDTAGPSFVDSAVWTVCVNAPTLFTKPLPPVSDVIADCGLEQELDSIAPPGFDFAQWRFELQCNWLAKKYDIEPRDAFELRSLVAIYESMADSDDLAAQDPGGHRGLVAEIGSALSNPLLAELLADEILRHAGDPAALGLFAETLEPQVSRKAKPAYRWLRATALEQLGDVEAAEREYLAAESMDTEFWPTLLDLARYASDRGDAERGLALLHRAGADADHPLVQILQQHRATPRTDLGRNDACWCGSGRKYKKCHLGNEQLALEKRAGWLYQKACQHVDHTRWSAVLEEVAEARSAYEDPEAPAPPTFDDPLIIDAVLFEGGALEDFVATRGPLLPDDERLLAEQWLLVDRSVFEVEQVHLGRTVGVRDVRTGDVREVSERTATAHLKPGQLICARVLPVGDSFQFFGGLEPVALHERNPLIELLDSEPDPVELVEFLTRRFAPPTLVNIEGDLLVMCEAKVRIEDPARMVAELDGAFDRADEGETRMWVDHVTTHGMARIGATLNLDGDALTVRTNSEARMDRVLATLTTLDPSATVVDETRTPISDARQFARMAPMAASVVSEDDPDVAAALDEVIRQYEAAWLDERIPALEGYTPRQAAEDPTRRGDVIRLLASFPSIAGGMNADRLRTALGL